MTTNTFSKQPLQEIKFLTESIAGVFFLMLLVITMALLAIGFSGINTAIQILVPFTIGVVILSLTLALKKSKSNKISIYFIYILLFIVCSSGSFNSIFSFFSKGSYYNTESAKWQENLIQLNTSSNLIFDRLSNKDSIITAIRQQNRKLENEIRDNGFKNRADEYFRALDAMLGGGKLKKPTNQSPDPLVIEDNINIINQQVDAFISDIELNLSKVTEKFQPKREQYDIKTKKIIEKLSSISSSSNQNALIQEAKNIHTQISTDVKTLTGINPIGGIPLTKFEIKELNNIMDTFSILGNSSEREKYASALLIALIFSLLIEGTTIFLSIILANTPDNLVSKNIDDLYATIASLKNKINELELAISSIEEQHSTQNSENRRKLNELNKSLLNLQTLFNESEKMIENISSTKSAILTKKKK